MAELDKKAEISVAEEEEKLPAEEENQAEEEEVSLSDLQKELEDTKQNLENQNDKYRDLSKRLTQTQQEKAELYRYHTATLPKINKTFNERWEDSPQEAVTDVVKEHVDPTARELAHIRAKQAETDLLIRNPEYKDLRDQVMDLGDRHQGLTSTPEGIEALYKMAEADKLRDEVKKLRSNGEADSQKERAFTESSSPKPPPQKRARKLSSAERVVSQNLGISEEEYMKQIGRIESSPGRTE